MNKQNIRLNLRVKRIHPSQQAIAVTIGTDFIFVPDCRCQQISGIHKQIDDRDADRTQDECQGNIAALVALFVAVPDWFLAPVNSDVTRELALLFALGSLAYVWRAAFPLSLVGHVAVLLAPYAP